MSTEQQQLEYAIAALEGQRTLLGDAMVDMAVAPLKAKLVALLGTTASPPPEPTQALKQVSVLFLDVVGSTTLAQRLDPEEVSAVMDGALSRGTALVEAHGGRVLQYAGDNILAAFGADEVAEDDAERAVRCGLALLALGKTVGSEVQAAHGHAGLDVRVGIHTGGVLLGGGVDEDGAIRGQAVNIAARMEQTAPAGGLRISHDSYSLVRGLFDVSAPEPLLVKGISEPIVSYLVHKAKPRAFRIASRGIEGVATKMIGRDAEFEALQASFYRLFAERQLLTVSVVAEAGIGKSRLLDEFQAWTEDRPESVYLFRGRATPQTQGRPFGLLRDIVAWRLQLSDDDTLSQAKAKIEAGLIPLFADEPEFAQCHAHSLGHLIGLDWKDSPHLRGMLDDPRQIRNRAQHAAAQMFRRVSAQDGSPVILQLEDLHWADDESLDFFRYLGEVNHDMPLWVLAFTRPTLFERRPDWRNTETADSRHDRIDLYPLDKTDSRQLVDELLKKLPEIPAALRELVIGGAEGNPFYMEELVRMLIDQGAINTRGEHWRLNAERLLATHVPSTLTGVLQARLDGLPPEERCTLQQASVIGQVFWDRALLALNAQSEATLPKLVQRELALLRPDAASSLPDGLCEYAFKHAILHQVTYGTVLKRHKKLLHAQLADWLAAQSRGDSARAGDFLALTALHYTEAGDAANAAEFHGRAAEHAATRLSHRAVLDHVQQALALLDGALSQGAGSTGGWAAVTQAGDQTQALLRWRLLSVRERTLDTQGERAPQGADIGTLAALAEVLDDDARRADAAYRRGARAVRMADWTVCKASARQAVAMCDRELARRAVHAAPPSEESVRLLEQRLLAQRLVGLALLYQGQPDAAQTLLVQTLEEARVRGLPKPQALCLSVLAILAEGWGDWVLAIDLYRQFLVIMRQVGDRRNEAVGLVNVGIGWLNLGHLTAARSDLEEGLRLVRQNGDRTVQCGPLCNLSALALWHGDDARALSLARTALDTAVETQARDWEVEALVALGNAEAALGREAPAAQAYRRAGVVGQEIGYKKRFDAGAGLARLGLARGDVAGAMQQVETLLQDAVSGTPAEADGAGDAALPVEDAAAAEATAPASTAFERACNRLIELTVHRVFAAAGDPRAAAWLQRAHSALMAEADRITDPALRQMFLSNIPEHRDIVALWAARGAR